MKKNMESKCEEAIEINATLAHIHQQNASLLLVWGTPYQNREDDVYVECIWICLFIYLLLYKHLWS